MALRNINKRHETVDNKNVSHLSEKIIPAFFFCYIQRLSWYSQLSIHKLQPKAILDGNISGVEIFWDNKKVELVKEETVEKTTEEAEFLV